MIPKTIHYCWFGRKPKPRLFYKCLDSWRTFCPDYHIIEWNEDNCPIEDLPLYAQQAYHAKKWAFVSDVARLKIVLDNGGIYFDTDVELLKGVDDLLGYDAFFSSENGIHVNTGLGFGAIPHNLFVKKMFEDYWVRTFEISPGQWDLTPCPILNTHSICAFLGGAQQFDKVIIKDNHIFLPRDWFNPLDFTTHALMYKSANTHAIHWYSASWFDSNEQMQIKRKHLIYCFHRFFINIFGIECFQRMKKLIISFRFWGWKGK